MRIAVSMFLVLSFAVIPALSQTNSKSDPVRKLSDAERAKIKAQVVSLQKSKTQAAENATKSLKDTAIKQGQTVDQRLKDDAQRIDRVVGGQPWLSGAGAQRKQALTAEAEAQKQKIAAEAKKKAAEQAAAAKKAADNVTESVEGLKSQVSKDGKYGLKPQGSNVYVRQYGKQK